MLNFVETICVEVSEEIIFKNYMKTIKQGGSKFK